MADQTSAPMMDPNLLNQLLQMMSQSPSMLTDLFGQPQMSPDLGPEFTANMIIGRLKSGRPIVRNADGSVSSHRNIVASFGNKSFIIPTLYGGKQYSEDEAINIIRANKFVDPDTGQPLIPYKSDDEALKAEKILHDMIEQEMMTQVRMR